MQSTDNKPGEEVFDQLLFIPLKFKKAASVAPFLLWISFVHPQAIKEDAMNVTWTLSVKKPFTHLHAVLPLGAVKVKAILRGLQLYFKGAWHTLSPRFMCWPLLWSSLRGLERVQYLATLPWRSAEGGSDKCLGVAFVLTAVSGGALRSHSVGLSLLNVTEDSSAGWFDLSRETWVICVPFWSTLAVYRWGEIWAMVTRKHPLHPTTLRVCSAQGHFS